MDSHNYTEYCFYLGSLSYDALLVEAEDHGVNISGCTSSADIRSAILLAVS